MNGLVQNHNVHNYIRLQHYINLTSLVTMLSSSGYYLRFLIVNLKLIIILLNIFKGSARICHYELQTIVSTSVLKNIFNYIKRFFSNHYFIKHYYFILQHCFFLTFLDCGKITEICNCCLSFLLEFFYKGSRGI